MLNILHSEGNGNETSNSVSFFQNEACTGCRESMSFEDVYAYIHSHTQKEWLWFIYQCRVRNAIFDEVLSLAA